MPAQLYLELLAVAALSWLYGAWWGYRYAQSKKGPSG